MPTIQPSEAFAMLANDTRVDILRELGRAQGAAGPDGQTYSGLMDAVGARDSGRFNYHLNRLLDHFVVREDGRYSLSYAGGLVYRSVVAGTFSEAPPRRPLETESACHECGDRLVVRADDDVRHVTCDGCDTTFLAGYLPPRAYADRTPADVLAVLDRRVRAQLGLVARSICPWCYGTTSAELLPADGTPLAERPVEVTVRHTCSQCDAEGWTTVGQRILAHPEVVAFHAHHDLAISEVPLWELPFAVSDRFTTVPSGDTCRARLSIPAADDRLDVTVSADAAVEAITWAARDDPAGESAPSG